MTWNATFPDGTVSVKANKTIGQQNTTYIETNMGNTAEGSNAVTTRDHYWNVDADLDGRHRFIQSKGFEVGGSAADPVLGTSMDSVLYAKLKSTLESTAQQDVQYFLRNSGMVMQMLGIRAMGVFNGSAATPSQASVVYSHNLATQSAGTKGIVRTGTGLYTIKFSNALPSANYLVLGGAIRNNASASSELLFEVQGATSLSTVKSTTTLKVMFRSDGGTAHDPLQAWFVCFGG